ncbi:hypothetical protein IEQ34_013464 [Dendrobium chrysotoxum]|uniref:Uncharacterized protein n=1 Tax=Dendrobium chrysotoxum TaxID=161865 RepID=A0AAV7GRR1_DENCH|nr:hypothetical protein IEQ34_013464 [Dendrobium chrysotoxum]
MSVKDMEYPKSQLSPPLKQKIQSTSFLFCCFRGAVAEEEPPMVAASLLRSSSSWIRARVSELPDIKERYMGMLARKGESLRQGCGEFRYDALSYALNFDEGGEDDDGAGAEETRYRRFSSRLPASPPQTVVGVAFG